MNQIFIIMDALVSAHSGLRYIVLAMLVFAIVNALLKRKSNKYEATDKKINLFAMIVLHIQLLIGLILYFTSYKVQFVEGFMGEASLRFFAVEHILLMVIAIALITLGRRKAEKFELPGMKHKQILRYYTIGLALILISIPWPFTHPELGTSWF